MLTLTVLLISQQRDAVMSLPAHLVSEQWLHVSRTHRVWTTAGEDTKVKHLQGGAGTQIDAVFPLSGSGLSHLRMSQMQLLQKRCPHSVWRG